MPQCLHDTVHKSATQSLGSGLKPMPAEFSLPQCTLMDKDLLFTAYLDLA